MSLKNVLISLISLIYISGCTEKVEPIPNTLISFNEHIRPILNKSCTGCHGGVGKQSNVSFIYREEALARGHSGRLTIVPGDPDASELIVRVESTDPNIRMPYKAAPLPDHEIALLRQWIEEGAQWEEHWAFIKPKNFSVPQVKNTKVINNEIDSFLQKNLEKLSTTINNKHTKANTNTSKKADIEIEPEIQLSLAPIADKSRLLRRASLDLIGLPPTTEEINAYLADDSSGAFEKQVDRLLASPRYGERWAAMWMDLARYADSHGYTRDEYRETWPYKQWVIEALNENKSYKDLVIEQIAGDLLPQRTLNNIIATGFHRQTPSNSEGGTDDEEFRMVAVMDRNATTWSTLNAMTINCVQCHSHPYDPIEHHEYYTSLSFFNTSKDADYRDYQPLYKLAAKKADQKRAFEIQEQMITISQHEAQTAFNLAQTTFSDFPWEKLEIETAKGDEFRGLQTYIQSMESKNKQLILQGKKVNYRHLELIKVGHKRLTELAENNQKIRTYQIQDGEYFEPGKFEARVFIHLTTKATEYDQTINALRLNTLPQDPQKARHTPEAPFYIDEVKVFKILINGKREQLPIRTFMSNTTEVMDAQLSELSALSTDHNGLNTGKGAGWYAHRLYLPRWSVAVLNKPLLLLKGEKLEFELSQMQLNTAADGMIPRLHRVKIEASSYDGWTQYAYSAERTNNVMQYGKLKQQLSAINGYAMPVILEQDNWDNRGMAKFNRGNMIAKVGPLLEPGTPNIFPKFTEEKTRLGLSQWFFKHDQPLTARVAVNRLWQRLFGIGIVATLEDFGSAGALPKHPELLDWLAIKFQHEYQWDMKEILKLMVMSHAYQQDATVSPALLELDPQNQLFARGPRQRLTAEMVRDQALMASGLIVHKVGGKPSMPPQPDGIWGHPGKDIKEWTNATGEHRYRRAIYTFIKRAFMYPSFLTFDMETREFSHERRIPTNTPLQALVTLNDPVYHEAAQHLGHYMEKVQQKNDDLQAISIGFQRVLSRQPSETELNILNQALTKVNQEALNESADTHKVKENKWTAMASILLNLDEALTR